MIAVYIILGLLLLIGLLLIIPIKIHILINDGFCVKLKYLLFGIKLYPKDKSENEKAKTDDEEKQKTPSQIKEFTKNLIAEKGVLDALKEIFSIVKELLRPFVPFFAKAQLDIKELTVVISSPDAAITAIEYGAVCGFMYDGLAIIEKKCRLKRKNIRVFSDFLNDRSSIKATIVLGIKPFTLFPLIKSLVKVYINRILKPKNTTKKGDVKNG